MTPESLETETKIDIAELDSREFSKLDRASLEKVVVALSQKHDAIAQQNRDRLSEVKRLQSEAETESSKLPQINGTLLSAKKVLEKLQVESQLVEDAKNLRPLCDRVNSLSRQLYDLLAEYSIEVSRIEKLQKCVDFRAEFKSNVGVGDLPVIEHCEGSNQFQLKTVNAASYQRQNRTNPFQDADFGFSNHVYRPKN